MQQVYTFAEVTGVKYDPVLVWRSFVYSDTDACCPSGPPRFICCHPSPLTYSIITCSTDVRSYL